MEALKQIANIAGHSGLYRILKPSRSGVIVETLDEKKEKTMMGPSARVSVLHDISVYVDTADESMPLGEVFMAIADKFGDELPVTAKSANNELTDFMEEALPDYDRERVRPNDIKKIVSWYTILRKNAPDVFEKSNSTETQTTEPSAEASEASTSEAGQEEQAPA
ncbi:DUF5606 domain-containing protein [Nibrella viscosa]|uniref:DUF5606 domain-containing protein n=1 Tax=Nibrella viscosa TaxID=1084524 RepID=A0ABP8KVK7_9BACT